jgi:hypothetical protein
MRYKLNELYVSLAQLLYGEHLAAAALTHNAHLQKINTAHASPWLMRGCAFMLVATDFRLRSGWRPASWRGKRGNHMCVAY